jgi:hypothetical protein
MASSSSLSCRPHAYHLNLPVHHVDPTTGVPYITTFCQHKVQQWIRLVLSIRLDPKMYCWNEEEVIVPSDEQEDDDDGLEEEDEEYLEDNQDSPATTNTPAITNNTEPLDVSLNMIICSTPSVAACWPPIRFVSVCKIL